MRRTMPRIQHTMSIVKVATSAVQRTLRAMRCPTILKMQHVQRAGCNVDMLKRTRDLQIANVNTQRSNLGTSIVARSSSNARPPMRRTMSASSP